MTEWLLEAVTQNLTIVVAGQRNNFCNAHFQLLWEALTIYFVNYFGGLINFRHGNTGQSQYQKHTAHFVDPLGPKEPTDQQSPFFPQSILLVKSTTDDFGLNYVFPHSYSTLQKEQKLIYHLQYPYMECNLTNNSSVLCLIGLSSYRCMHFKQTKEEREALQSQSLITKILNLMG